MTFLITGSSRGIGLELANLALQAGHKVIACVRDPSKSSELTRLRTQYSERLQVVEMDTSSDASVKKAADQITEPIDVLINNAGVYLDSRSSNLSELQSKIVS